VGRGERARAVVAGVAVGVAGFLVVEALQAAPANVRVELPSTVGLLASQRQSHPGVPRHEDIVRVHKLEIPLGRSPVDVPIVMYHHVRVYNGSDAVQADLSVTPDEFRAQMDWLWANDYHPVGFTELRAYLHGRQPLPSRPLILTFDDGYLDFYTTAYPILAQHGFKAVSYDVSGLVGAPGYMNADQIRELDRAGVEIGSHTKTHADLTTLDHDALMEQLQQPKQFFEKLLGHPVVDFCYPSGRFDATVEQAVAEVGYQTATTTQPGNEHSLGDSLTWGRVRVHEHEPMDTYTRLLSEVEPPVETWTEPFPAPQLPLLPEVYPFVYRAPATRP
jgi:peptidoglycan/xylan/chitin deacetylase (PgdA/CDA1 family)